MTFPLSKKYEKSDVAVAKVESNKGKDVQSEKSQDIIAAEPYPSNDEKKETFWSRFRFSVDTTDHPPQIFNKTLYLSIFVLECLVLVEV